MQWIIVDIFIFVGYVHNIQKIKVRVERYVFYVLPTCGVVCCKCIVSIYKNEKKYRNTLIMYRLILNKLKYLYKNASEIKNLLCHEK